MPYVKCSNCHHEWESVDEEDKCDWCGAPIGKVLEKMTPLERMLNRPIKVFLKFLTRRNNNVR